MGKNRFFFSSFFFLFLKHNQLSVVSSLTSPDHRLTCMDGRDGQKSPGQNRREESGASHLCENRNRHERQQSV